MWGIGASKASVLVKCFGIRSVDDLRGRLDYERMQVAAGAGDAAAAAVGAASAAAAAAAAGDTASEAKKKLLSTDKIDKELLMSQPIHKVSSNYSV